MVGRMYFLDVKSPEHSGLFLLRLFMISPGLFFEYLIALVFVHIS